MDGDKGSLKSKMEVGPTELRMRFDIPGVGKFIVNGGNDLFIVLNDDGDIVFTGIFMLGDKRAIGTMRRQVPEAQHPKLDEFFNDMAIEYFNFLNAFMDDDEDDEKEKDPEKEEDEEFEYWGSDD